MALVRCAGAQTGVPHTAEKGAALLRAAAFAGADASAQINACERAARANADAQNGRPATCDARSFTGTYVMQQQITVLSKTVLLIPHYGNWLWDLRDGVSAGILQQGSSSMIGTAPGGGGNQMLLGPASNHTNMLALYATDVLTVGGGSYIYASGFNAQNLDLGDRGRSYPGARFAHGVVYTRHLFDESRFERIMAENDFGDSWHIANTCCDTEFVQVQATGNYQHGGTPLVVENGEDPMTIDAKGFEVAGVKGGTHAYALGPAAFSWSGTVNAAGPHHPNIRIEPNNTEIVFPYLYTETAYKDHSDASAPVIDNAGKDQHITIVAGGMQIDGKKPLFSHPEQPGLVVGAWGAPRTYASDVRGGRVGLANADQRGAGNVFATMYGTTGAGNLQFKPPAPGWYQIFGGYPGLRGMFEVQVGFATNITGTVSQNFYGGPANITVLNAVRQRGDGNNPVDAVATWSPDGSQRAAMAIHVASLPNDGEAISINLLGQGIDSRGILHPKRPMTKAPSEADASFTAWHLPDDATGAVGLMSSGAVMAPAMIGRLRTPKGSSAPCVAGEAWDDANFHYVCVARNTIKRVALSSF